MCGNSNSRPDYHLLDCSLAETPARMLDFDSWPRRDAIRSGIIQHEWFDWSELFIEGIPDRLSLVSKEFESSSIRIACLATDNQSISDPFIRIVEIDSARLSASYFKAIWDEQSTRLSGKLAAVARIVLVWDSTEKWIILNDRFYEIGLFVLLGRHFRRVPHFFHRLDALELLDRFSRILRVNKVAGLAQIDRWSDDL